MMLETGREEGREKKIWQIHKAVWLHCGHVAASTTTEWPNLTFHLLSAAVFFSFLLDIQIQRASYVFSSWKQ